MGDEINTLFDSFDQDRSGSISYQELSRCIRARGTTEKSSNIFGNLELNASFFADKTMQEQLRDALGEHAMRVIDFMKLLDTNRDNHVSKREFRHAMFQLGLNEIYMDEINALFDSFDQDRSGSISCQELSRCLRARGTTV